MNIIFNYKIEYKYNTFYMIKSMSNDRVSQMISVQKESLDLFKKKNADYGDSFATYGPVGVIVRMGDKISRLSSVSKNGINLVNTESIRDTLIDLHNYAAMAVMLIDGNEKQIKHKRIEEIQKEEQRLNLESQFTPG